MRRTAALAISLAAATLLVGCGQAVTDEAFQACYEAVQIELGLTGDMGIKEASSIIAQASTICTAAKDDDPAAFMELWGD